MSKTNSLLFGPIGSGKSRSVRTLLREWPDENGQLHKGAGKEVMLLALEAGAEASYKGLTCEMGFHRHQHLPADVPWDMMQDWIEKLGRLAKMEDMANMIIPSTVRQEFQQFLELYSICQDYKCDACGESFGGVSDWTDERAFVMDGLSGLSDMAIHFVVGPKPFLPLALYQPVQKLIGNFLKKCVGIPASFVLIAHWDKEVNPVTGTTSITIDTVGQKLAPQLMKIFDEIICTRREKDKFFWSSLEDRVEQKVRRLPWSDSIEPSFELLFPVD